MSSNIMSAHSGGLTNNVLETAPDAVPTTQSAAAPERVS